MKLLFKLFLILFWFNAVCQGQTIEIFDTPGEGTWVCPPGVTSVTVECWGGGGSGGGGINGSGLTSGGVARGGGGAGGGYVKSTIAVTPGQSYNFKVGAGGIGIVPAYDNETSPSGENTWFIDANSVNAPGGQGGKGRVSTSSTVLSGAGGVYNGATAIGTVKYKGGNGGTATSSPQMSGSGGSSGGTESDGTNGSNVNTQSTVTGGGFGAAGRNNASNGNNGGTPGGGGGGARANTIAETITTNQQSGGNGGSGQIKLSYLGVFPTIATIDWANNNKPAINYKRGSASPGQNGFRESQQTRNFLDIQASLGMTIHNGIRNLFKDPETTEFYQENGVFKNQQNPAFTSIRQYATSKGFELISQVGGTPRNSGYEFDSSYYKVLPWEPWTDFAPIPKEGVPMQEFQRNFAEWAINADKAVAPDFHSIWIGTQEIAHTIGFPGGLDYDTDENKNLNIRRFTDYWKPISDELRKAGARTGALQLNSSNKNIYNYAVDYMIQQKLQVDFLTYQFYQFGDTIPLNAAVIALDRYNMVYPGTKIIVDRGASGKIMPDGVTNDSSEGVIFYLVGELCAMNNADKMYAITLDAGENTMSKDQNNIYWQTRKWLNTMGPVRCNLSGLPSGVDGFVTRNDKKLSAVIWNRSSIARSINLKINNANFGADSQFAVKHASGSSFVNSTASWDASTNTVTGITLNPFDYVLIDLESAVTGLDKSTADKLNVYPNPVKDKLYISQLNEKSGVEIYNLQGSLMLIDKKVFDGKSIDVSDLDKGIYLVKIIGNDMVKTTSFIKF